MKTPTNTTIYRYDIDPTKTALIFELPKGAEAVDLGPDPIRGGQPSIWFAVDPNEQEKEKFVVARCDTGQATGFNPTDLTFLNRGLGVGASTSQPGQMSLRSVFYFHATGAAAQEILELETIMADAE